jgi:hypothetical protein
MQPFDQYKPNDRFDFINPLEPDRKRARRYQTTFSRLVKSISKAITWPKLRLMTDANRRAELNAWLTHKIRPLFAQRVLDITEDGVFKWRLLVGEGRKSGYTFSCVGTPSPSPPSRRCGLKRMRSGSLVAVSQGKSPVISDERRDADLPRVRASPLQPRRAARRA